jgi:hypothetical protein
MKVMLIKPWGYENYVALDNIDDFMEFFNAASDGEEYVVKIIEMLEEEFTQLGEFTGF